MQGKRIRQVNNIVITQIETHGFIAWAPNNKILYVSDNFDLLYFRCTLCNDYIDISKRTKSEGLQEYEEYTGRKAHLEFNKLNYKCKVFGRVFEISVQEGLDSYAFVSKVMTSKTLDWLFVTDDCTEWCDGEFLYGVLYHHLMFKKGQTLDPYIMQFAGYLYKYWMSTRHTSRRQIYKILPLERLEATFGFYHTQGWDYIIEDAIKVYKEGNYII